MLIAYQVRKKGCMMGQRTEKENEGKEDLVETSQCSKLIEEMEGGGTW